MASYPENVGILAIDIYFPLACIQQMGQLGQLEAQLQLPCCSGQMLLAFERKFRRSHMSHAYDFDKPNLANGKLSQTCYLMALDFCYKHFCEKFEKLQGRTFSISDADYFVFRSPSNKLVQKCFAWLFLNDFLRNASGFFFLSFLFLVEYTGKSTSSKHLYDSKVQSSTLLPKQVGNMYTASLYVAFASVLHNKHKSLVGKRVVMFSYGSGLTATIFSLKLQDGQHPFNLFNIVAVMNISKKLKLRHEFPSENCQHGEANEHQYGAKDFVTSKDSSFLIPGTYYLTEVDSMSRRFYTRKANATTTFCQPVRMILLVNAN
ncbi:hypothetical protein CRYUN_Cryun19dG0071700 [Craigia yunnanensis]